MKITSITLFFACFSVSAISYIITRIKRDLIGIRSAVMWLLTWLCIGFFSLFPGLLNWIMKLAQMESRMFFIIIVAIFVLFAVVFSLGSRIDKIERNLGRLIQEVAILNYRIGDRDEPKDKSQK